MASFAVEDTASDPASNLLELYLTETSRYPLLDKAGEFRLGKLMEAGKNAQAKLELGKGVLPANE